MMTILTEQSEQICIVVIWVTAGVKMLQQQVNETEVKLDKREKGFVGSCN